MPKSSSPVRLQAALMRSAALAGALHHRSAAQQIEYWASLGQGVSSQLDPESLLDVAAGLARLKVEPVAASPVDPAAVFAALETDRHSGALVQAVSSAAVRYQAFEQEPGWLECIPADGTRSIGCFELGRFVAKGD